MMMIHPAHALLLADIRHHELVTRADTVRLARRIGAAAAQPDCRVPVATFPAPPCRPDPRRAVAGPSIRHRVPRKGILLRTHR
jgi:hypothetical protein